MLVYTKRNMTWNILHPDKLTDNCNLAIIPVQRSQTAQENTYKAWNTPAVYRRIECNFNTQGDHGNKFNLSF